MKRLQKLSLLLLIGSSAYSADMFEIGQRIDDLGSKALQTHATAQLYQNQNATLKELLEMKELQLNKADNELQKTQGYVLQAGKIVDAFKGALQKSQNAHSKTVAQAKHLGSKVKLQSQENDRYKNDLAPLKNTHYCKMTWKKH